jgi:hypothetical protein
VCGEVIFLRSSIFDFFDFFSFFFFPFSRDRCARGFVLCDFSYRQTSSPFSTFGENEFIQIITVEKKEYEGTGENRRGFLSHGRHFFLGGEFSYNRIWAVVMGEWQKKARAESEFSSFRFVPNPKKPIFIKEIRYCVSLS